MSTLFTSITYDESTSLVMMTLRGTVSAEDVLKTYQRANSYATNYKCSKILIDVTELDYDLAVIDIAALMPEVASELQNIKLARVVNFSGYRHDLFLQKAKHFGITVENFDCFRSAKLWLSNSQ
jgi:hypothetical protein